MSEGVKMADIIAVANAISERRATDERFAEVLTEVSTALAEIVEALSKKDEKTEARDEAREAEMMGKAIAAALLAGLRNMPAPTIKAPEAQAQWSSLRLVPERDVKGSVTAWKVQKIA